jgi:sulfite reductase (ferredoxin)
MQGYKLSEKLDKDIQELESLIERFKQGQISAVELKAHRVPFGVYEQREPDTYMVRVRCAGGYLSPFQFERIAQISSDYAIGQIHLTTRQELQIHYVKLEDIIRIIKSLRDIGLASRGGGGNTVRNITAQEDAGIDSKELFDVSPYSIALTTKLIDEDDSWTLPRKFKIAFSGSEEDKGYASIADLGFIAKIKDRERGFKVYAAGGLGAKSRVGNIIFDFIPSQDVYIAAKAVKAVFWKYGNRKNKHAARLRFLYQSLGQEEFKKRVEDEYLSLKNKDYLVLEIEGIENKAIEPGLEPELAVDSADFEIWKRRFTKAQKQAGLFALTLPIRLGFIDYKKALKLARFFTQFGSNILRLTKEQNILVRNISLDYLGNIYNWLKNNMDNFNKPLILDKIISCAGASTCQLGICQSRAAATAIIKALEVSNLDLDSLADIKINISGCPNSCGQHPLADLGFFGKAGRKDNRLYPAYNVVAGAIISGQQTLLAEPRGEVSAKDLHKFIEDFLAKYLTKINSYKSFAQYLSKEGSRDLQQVLARYQNIPTFAEDKNYYFDWGQDRQFSLADRGAGECSAGLFDLIELDLKNIVNTKLKLSRLSDIAGDKASEHKAEHLRELVFYTSRMLLITRGVEAKTEAEVFESFIRDFIDSGLVSADFRDLVQASRDKDYKLIVTKEQSIYALAQRVQYLYENMDSAFRFNLEQPKTASIKTAASTNSSLALGINKPAIVKDLRGVACPINFVKTKIELAKVKAGQIVEIWLDDGSPIENVPASLKAEGHNILEQSRIDNYWKVIIEKK